MTKEEIRVGDVVRLNSGGPLMTINGWDSHDRVNCTWFHESKVESAYFLPLALTKQDKLV